MTYLSFAEARLQQLKKFVEFTGRERAGQPSRPRTASSGVHSAIVGGFVCGSPVGNCVSGGIFVLKNPGPGTVLGGALFRTVARSLIARLRRQRSFSEAYISRMFSKSSQVDCREATRKLLRCVLIVDGVQQHSTALA
ncbi:hypothetical protein pipiens_004955 [Culex pipiens pipiens]|uniref:Uncharacterized protein n=1 Tax=Culex pipiens pipiens TaxID=38569 RepID=A0ABD1CD04_CULPP